MKYCECCGAAMNDADVFCGECGMPVSKAAEPIDRSSEPFDDAKPTMTAVSSQPWDPTRAPARPAPAPVQQPVQSMQQPVQPAQQPVWAQYVNQPNGYAQPTFVVPKRPLGKGGAITMIIFGSIMLAVFTFFLFGMIISLTEGDVDASAMIAAGVTMALTFLAGGLLLLLFGIRRIKNVNRYNASL